MKNLLLSLLPILLTACSVRPNNIVAYTTNNSNHNIKVIYNQRVPHSLGGEEYVYIQLNDARKFTIDINGRFSEFLHASISKDGLWYRFYLKDRYLLVGHTQYRDFDNDGELDRYWVSKSEDPKHARPHPYSIVAYLNRSTGKVYRENRDFGFNTTAERDYFGSKSELKSSQQFFGYRVDWKPMNRQ